MLLVLPHTPLATAQSIPEINEAMEAQNSWVIVDWKGQRHYKFEGIAYVVSLSPVFGFFCVRAALASHHDGGHSLLWMDCDPSESCGSLYSAFQVQAANDQKSRLAKCRRVAAVRPHFYLKLA